MYIYPDVFFTSWYIFGCNQLLCVLQLLWSLKNRFAAPGWRKPFQWNLAFFFFGRFFFLFFLGFEVKREERERKEFVSGVADIIPKILPAAPPWTVWQTCPWPPTLSAEDNGPSDSSRCVWAKPKRARARAGNGQEGIGMSDREAQCEWWWWCWWEKEKKKGNLRRESEELLGFRFNSAGSFFSLCAETGPAH